MSTKPAYALILAFFTSTALGAPTWLRGPDAGVTRPYSSVGQNYPCDCRDITNGRVMCQVPALFTPPGKATCAGDAWTCAMRPLDPPQYAFCVPK